jgi:hypothetical protein
VVLPLSALVITDPLSINFCFIVFTKLPSTDLLIGVETRLVEVHNKTNVLVAGKTHLIYDQTTRYEEH